jgi:hypothetical protein
MVDALLREIARTAGLPEGATRNEVLAEVAALVEVRTAVGIGVPVSVPPVRQEASRG